MVIRLTDPRTSDVEFRKAFIATFQSFASSDELFTKLVQRYENYYYSSNYDCVVAVAVAAVVFRCLPLCRLFLLVFSILVIVIVKSILCLICFSFFQIQCTS